MKKFLIILCVLVAASLALAKEQDSRQRRPRQPRCQRAPVVDANASVEEKNVQEQKKEKPDYRSVIVDAWLVQVKADALYESGVKPIPQKDKENASIMNLLWCLGDPNNGKVVASARTQAHAGKDGFCELSKTEYIEQKKIVYDANGRKTAERPNFVPYECKIAFRNEPAILESGTVWIEFGFDSKLISQGDSYSPRNAISVNFNNRGTTIPAQKPIIVAQAHIGDEMLFLILRAEIVE